MNSLSDNTCFQMTLPSACLEPIAAHELNGRELCLQRDGSRWVVEQVYEAWWKGGYQQARVRELNGTATRALVVGLSGSLSQEIAEEFAAFTRLFVVAEPVELAA
jgi:hypothetical protein